MYAARTAEAAVAVGLDLYVGLHEASRGERGAEAQILDREAAAQPLTLVVGLDTKDLVLVGSAVEVVGVGDDLLSVTKALV